MLCCRLQSDKTTPITFLEWPQGIELLLSVFRMLHCSPAGSRKGKNLTVAAKTLGGKAKNFNAIVRIDTPQEILYYENGGILQYVLRQLVAS